MARIAKFVLAASLIAGCKLNGPLGAVGAIVTAPVTAPVMFVSGNRACALIGGAELRW